MTAPVPLPPVDAPSPPEVRRRTSTVATAPDRRELLGLAALGGVIALAHATALGERIVGGALAGDGLVGTAATVPASEALLVVLARTFPWLLGVLGLGGLFAVRWMPRAHQRLVEPSLIAGWVSFVAGGALAWLLGRSGLWPWTWTTTSPETATLLARFIGADQGAAAVSLLLVLCLAVPLLSEVLFRHALLEGLRTRGHPTWRAVTLAALAFGLVWLLAGWSAAPSAALRQALVATLAGIALGTVAVRSPRGRGLGLCVIAHMGWMCADTWALLRTLPME